MISNLVCSNNVRPNIPLPSNFTTNSPASNARNNDFDMVSNLCDCKSATGSRKQFSNFDFCKSDAEGGMQPPAGVNMRLTLKSSIAS